MSSDEQQSEGLHGTTKCIRCDNEIPADPIDSNTLTYNQETGFVYACDDCFDVIKGRNVA